MSENPGSPGDPQVQRGSAASATGVSGEVSEVQIDALARKAPRAKPYKEKPFRQLVPAWHYPKAVGDQDASYFAKYNNAISGLVSSAAKPDNYGPAVLAASQRIYDDELSRRESINTRCGAVLSTGGILGALFVAAGQIGLTHQKTSYGIAAWFVLAAFIIALAYVGCSIVMALAVHASLRGNVMDPLDVIGPRDIAFSADAHINDYSTNLANRNLAYTVRNYETNNHLMFRLHSAQRCLRNGIVAIILAGMLSPLALHTAATSGTSALRAGSSAGGSTISAAVQGASP